LAMALTGDTFQSDERTKALGLLEASNGWESVESYLGSLIALSPGRHPFSFTASWHSHRTWRMVFRTGKEDNRSRDTLYQYWLKLKDVLQERLNCFFSATSWHDRPLSPLWRTELRLGYSRVEVRFFGLKKASSWQYRCFHGPHFLFKRSLSIR